MRRRTLLAMSLALPAIRTARAEAKSLKGGFQKGEPLEMTARASGGLAKFLGVDIEWIEFQFGPPMLEAMRVGSIDFGAVGDTPPIFAQAAHADLRYLSTNNGAPQTILLPPGSKIQTLADLKGKKIAFGRGSSAHNFLLLVLEKAGLAYSDIEPVYLGPADAGPAFERGAVDAWSIWEPYTSLFNIRPGVRALTTNLEIGKQQSFIMASSAFVKDSPVLAANLIKGLQVTAQRIRDDREKTAALLASSTGIAQDVWSRALAHDPFEVAPLTDDAIALQQKTADRFRAAGLIPTDIKVADIVWRPNPSKD